MTCLVLWLTLKEFDSSNFSFLFLPLDAEEMIVWSFRKEEFAEMAANFFPPLQDGVIQSPFSFLLSEIERLIFLFGRALRDVLNFLLSFIRQPNFLLFFILSRQLENCASRLFSFPPPGSALVQPRRKRGEKFFFS